MDFRLDGESQGERIRELFRECGNGEGIRSFARRCIDAGLFNEAQQEGFMIVGAISTVKKALKQSDEHGIHFAYNTSKQNGDDATWKQPALFDYTDACFVLQSNYIDKVTATHAEMVTFHQWMKRRFGTAPSVPDLVY